MCVVPSWPIGLQASAVYFQFMTIGHIVSDHLKLSTNYTYLYKLPAPAVLYQFSTSIFVKIHYIYCTHVFSICCTYIVVQYCTSVSGVVNRPVIQLVKPQPERYCKVRAYCSLGVELALNTHSLKHSVQTVHMYVRICCTIMYICTIVRIWSCFRGRQQTKAINKWIP